jgi:predicted ArsR family transcriptional regulator
MVDPEPWVARPHTSPRATPFPLGPEQRAAIEEAIRPAKAEQRIVRRGQALLLTAEGVSTRDTARALGLNHRTVRRLRKRFGGAGDPVAKLADAPRSGRPPSRSRTSTQPREGIDVSDRTVGRILASADLQPHRQKTYLTWHHIAR